MKLSFEERRAEWRREALARHQREAATRRALGEPGPKQRAPARIEIGHAVGHSNCVGCGRVLQDRGERLDGVCTDHCFELAADWLEAQGSFTPAILTEAMVRAWVEAGKPGATPP